MKPRAFGRSGDGSNPWQGPHDVVTRKVIDYEKNLCRAIVVPPSAATFGRLGGAG